MSIWIKNKGLTIIPPDSHEQPPVVTHEMRNNIIKMRFKSTIWIKWTIRPFLLLCWRNLPEKKTFQSFICKEMKRVVCLFIYLDICCGFSIVSVRYYSQVIKWWEWVSFHEGWLITNYQNLFNPNFIWINPKKIRLERK